MFSSLLSTSRTWENSHVAVPVFECAELPAPSIFLSIPRRTAFKTSPGRSLPQPPGQALPPQRFPAGSGSPAACVVCMCSGQAFPWGGAKGPAQAWTSSSPAVLSTQVTSWGRGTGMRMFVPLLLRILWQLILWLYGPWGLFASSTPVSDPVILYLAHFLCSRKLRCLLRKKEQVILKSANSESFQILS